MNQKTSRSLTCQKHPQAQESPESLPTCKDCILIWLSLEAKRKYPLLWERGINIVEQACKDPYVPVAELAGYFNKSEWVGLAAKGKIRNDSPPHPKLIEKTLSEIYIKCNTADGL